MRYKNTLLTLFSLTVLSGGCLDAGDATDTGDTGDTDGWSDVALEARCDFTPPPGTPLISGYNHAQPQVRVDSRGSAPCVFTPRVVGLKGWGGVNVWDADDSSRSSVLNTLRTIVPGGKSVFNVTGYGGGYSSLGATLIFEFADTDATDVEYPVDDELPPVG